MMTKPQQVCLAALGMASLVRDGRQWRFGRRAFSNDTVCTLIGRGLARRVGDRVIGILPLNDNGVE